MTKIKVRVRTPARMVMIDVDDSATVSDLKAMVRFIDYVFWVLGDIKKGS